jgi:hypothetical protein
MGNAKNLVGSLDGRGYLVFQGIYKKIILKWILRLQDKDWTYLSQDRAQSRALMNTIVQFRGP